MRACVDARRNQWILSTLHNFIHQLGLPLTWYGASLSSPNNLTILLFALRGHLLPHASLENITGILLLSARYSGRRIVMGLHESPRRIRGRHPFDLCSDNSMPA